MTNDSRWYENSIIAEERDRIITGLDETEWHYINGDQFARIDHIKQIVRDEP